MKDFKVLVVDDEADFVDTTIKRLTKRNIECLGVTNGKQAIELIRNSNFDVVLLDVRMPGMDGIETLQEIKQIKPYTEVIILTGHASVESGIDGMQFGAFDYLMKPMELELLIEKLMDAFEKKSLLQKAKIKLVKVTRRAQERKPATIKNIR